MTNQQKAELTWPLVALVALGLVFVFGVLYVIPADEPQLRTALLGAIVTGVGAVITTVLRQLDRKIEGQDRRESARAAARDE